LFQQITHAWLFVHLREEHQNQHQTIDPDHCTEVGEITEYENFEKRKIRRKRNRRMTNEELSLSDEIEA